MQHDQVVTGIRTTPTLSAPAGERSGAAGAFDYLRHPVRLTGQEKTTAVTRVRWLEQRLFDGDGHVRRQVSREQAQAIVDELNQLRAILGWLEIDLEGRWRWP
jgi:hypothetical protein